MKKVIAVIKAEIERRESIYFDTFSARSVRKYQENVGAIEGLNFALAALENEESSQG